MKNPLNKRYLRELKGDIGKYIAIFLFLVFFIGVMSGFLVTNNSVAKTFNEGLEKYRVEDGHITFNIIPDGEILEKLSDENDLTFYELFYKEEDVGNENHTLRVYKNRDVINLLVFHEGRAAKTADEIAIDRMYAANNNIKVGDRITIRDKEYKVTGLSSVPDYACLYESNSDMMFDAITFGVAFLSDEGYKKMSDAHESVNYAWVYNKKYADDNEAKKRSDDFIDSLEDTIKEYDEAQVQSQVNALYDKAKEIAKTLETQFEDASDTIENKIARAASRAGQKAIASLSAEEIKNVIVSKSGKSEEELSSKALELLGLTDEQKMQLQSMVVSGIIKPEETLGAALKLSGKTEDDLMGLFIKASGLSENTVASALIQKAVDKQGTSFDALVAAQLGTTTSAYRALTEAFENAEDMLSDVDADSMEAPVINFDELNSEKDYENEMDFDLDEIYSILDKIDATGIYNTDEIRNSLSQLKTLMNTEIDDSLLIDVKDYLPRYLNKAINFVIDDASGDEAGAMLMLYIIIAVIAFMYAVTTSNTITKEAGVIGTLRASGYSRGELTRHYLVLPMIITLIGALIGNVLGYFLFPLAFKRVYFLNYSIAPFEVCWTPKAFLLTTLIPLAIMFVIVLAVISKKLRIRPLNFLRGEVKKHGKKKVVRLPSKFPFFGRFRTRILFQNLSSYLVLFLGIFAAAIMAVFGSMFGPLIDDYTVLVQETKIAEYQYVLMDEVETENKDAEKYCITTLNTTDEKYVLDDIGVYGISENSRYVTKEIPDGTVLVSNGYMEKFGLSKGDKIKLKEPYGTKEYTFTVGGEYTYDAALSIFMNRSDYLKAFDEDKDYFTGYFSHEKLDDIDQDDIAAVITEADLAKIATQLGNSMGAMMSAFSGLGAVLFLLLMYILTKQVIEKNTRSIALTKILGFTNGEIGKLYLLITSLVVLASLLASIPLIDVALRWMFHSYMYTEMSGYIPYIIDNSCYVRMVVMGIVCYALVAIGMMIKLGKIPKGEALKNQEL